MARRRKTARGGPAALLGATAAMLLAAGGALWLLGGAARTGASLGGPWTLTRADGHTVSDRDFRGRPLLIYFGYTSCPDLCPTTLATVEAAMQRLGARADRLQPLFITVDPGRDTPEVVGRYVRGFGPSLVGLTGTAAQIGAVQREFHVRSAVHPGGGHGAIDHTSVLFLVGADGRGVVPLATDVTPDQLTARLASYLSQEPSRTEG